MTEEIHHNCGFCVAHSLQVAYSFTDSLQHRGREATGMAAVGYDRIDVVKWKGTVNRFELEDLHKIFPGHHYHTYMGHIRYATKGRKDKILEDAHPHVIGGEIHNKKNHIIVSDCEMAIVHNGQVNSEYLNDVDKNLLRTGSDTEALLHFYKKKGEYEIMKRIPGAYTMAIADKRREEVIVLRDRTGIKPGALGWKNGKYVVASEEIAFRKNGGKIIEDLDPGCIYFLGPNGAYTKEYVVEQKKALCFFELNYLSHVDSTLDGVGVRKLRETLGEELTKEFNPADIDLVTFLPRCPEPAARRFSKIIKKPFVPVFYKLRSERAFQGSTMNDRKNSIEQNLHLLHNVKTDLKGMIVVSIDDSTVRGNNSVRERELLYNEAGVKKCYHVSYTPQIGIIGKDGIPRGCMFGVDMPPNDSFIARGRTQEEISEIMKMPVFYISSEGMLRAFEKVGIPREDLCTYCIGGKHPFQEYIL